MLRSLRQEMNRWTPAEKAVFIGLLLFAIFVGIIGIERPIFVDEGYSVLTASDSWRGVIADLRNDNSLPLYYLFLHVWIRFFGISEIATRLPSIFFYLASIFACYKLAEELSGDSRVGLYSALFYGISLQAIHLAQKIRMYTLLGLIVILSLLFFFRYFGPRSSGKRSDWIAYTLISIVGVFVHVWFAFLLLAEIVCSMLFPRRNALWKLLGSIAISAGLFILLWGRIFFQQLHNGSTAWVPKINLWSVPAALVEFYGGPVMGTAILAAAAILLLWMKERDRRSFSEEDKRAQIALTLIFGLTVAVPLLISLVKPIYFLGRYTIIALPCLAILLGWRMAATVRRTLLPAFAGVVMVVVLSAHFADRGKMIENSKITWRPNHTDKSEARELIKEVRPGDTIVFTGVSRTALEYYLRRFHYDHRFTLISFPAEDANHLGWDNGLLDRPTLTAEADELMTRLAASSRQTHSSVWVVPDGNMTANDVVYDSLKRHFPSNLPNP